MEHPLPDTKDWTWVLNEPCPECGFDASSVPPDEVAGRVRANAAAWRGVLRRGDIVGTRPPVPSGQPPQWSALEYGAHVRDVYGLAAERLLLILKKKHPTFANWDQDATAIEDNYRSQDANKISYDLAVNAGRFADLLDKVRGDQWERTGLRSDGSAFTAASFAQYLLHDPVHHLVDVEKGFEAINEASQ
ncbi:MAG: DinB family protein [Acidimicrobiia bacterium]|nr:DinB family protein [Acidimicrobiia bacterium]MDH5519884.1 DinB family protein [Acidimicrobiia bacterium]